MGLMQTQEKNGVSQIIWVLWQTQEKIGFSQICTTWNILANCINDTAQLKTFTLDDDENDQLLFLELGCSHPLSPL